MRCFYDFCVVLYEWCADCGKNLVWNPHGMVLSTPIWWKWWDTMVKCLAITGFLNSAKKFRYGVGEKVRDRKDSIFKSGSWWTGRDTPICQGIFMHGVFQGTRSTEPFQIPRWTNLHLIRVNRRFIIFSTDRNKLKSISNIILFAFFPHQAQDIP